MFFKNRTNVFKTLQMIFKGKERIGNHAMGLK